MSTLKQGGASISARARTPSIDLGTLAGLLAKSLTHGGPRSSTVTSELAFLVFDAGARKLRLNTRAVLGRLFADPHYTPAFSPSDESGFIRDLDFPPLGTTARTGGRLVPGSEAKTTKAIEALRAAVVSEFDVAFAKVDPRVLIERDAGRAIERLAQRLNVRMPLAPASASLVPVAFAPSNRIAAEKEKDVARVLSAIEIVEGRDWLDKMVAGVRRKLEADDVPREEIDSILETIRLQRDQPGSQVRRFLDFLDDDALARVRLQVAFDLMEAVGRESNSACLAAYVSRVKECFDAFGGVAGGALPLQVGRAYGVRANGDLGDQLRKATFYKALPVWPEGSAQLFEARTEGDEGFATRREVTYRFRVNGDNPQTGKSAFASRLDRLEEGLSAPSVPPWNVQRWVAEVVFLRLVVPDSREGRYEDPLVELSRRLTSRLEEDPRGTLASIVTELRDREVVMNQIGEDLIRELRTRSRKVVDNVNRAARKYFVTVQKGILDWTALLSASPRAADVLVGAERGSDTVAWFRHLVINDDPAGVPGALASHTVETTLSERCLAPSGDKAAVSMRRQSNRPVLPIRFVPFRLERTVERTAWKPDDVFHGPFDVGCGLDIEYEIRSLSRKKDAENEQKATFEQWRAAGCAAFSLIVYVVLWELVRRLRAMEGIDGFGAFMVRLQPEARGAASSDGNAALYAMSQAIERALCRELPVKLQGFHTQGSADTKDWRKRGALWALQSGFPMETQLHGPAPLDKVALVSYVTRPCDAHPTQPDADGFLYVSRTYVAEAYDGGLRVQVESMRSRVVDSRKSFKEPQLVLEEIARLRSAGYRHVMLLSHHFGNQRIGRAAERHSPHGSFQFLNEAQTRFSDVFVYPLRRDVFPATRLHKRAANESGFEVLRFDEHREMFEAHRHVVPVYTFATLTVVGDEEERPQSGFCTYFLDDEHRLANEQSERVRQNILGVGDQHKIRDVLVALLRSLHYLESEKVPSREQMLPVLDPFGWAIPDALGTAGELSIMERRSKGNVVLSFPALLAHVTKVLHRDSE